MSGLSQSPGEQPVIYETPFGVQQLKMSDLTGDTSPLTKEQREQPVIYETPFGVQRLKIKDLL
ncbi:MAG: hypothetical protein PHZ00_01815 [Candidatus Peribacteraceae bacterium]|nr:hypothetical protein [Candidatus Peribacteraceae bacterium]